ncbi:hypothetical protein [Devosia naphthalenivorans]|uniref:hypothetical protein n=1 Tax=Devosia naphthalenivorans TaxID=2082392 RepID=UPI000D3D6780|nr:hypothetical protein [Devosia naphthalenivorans]
MNVGEGASGAILFGAGVLGGVMLVAMLPGMPWIASVPDPANNLDLGAQRSMAAAAWWMVVITAASAVVGAGGLYLIYRTLREAKRSADAADKAVAASLAAVEGARDIGQAQVRAYIIISRAIVAHMSSGEYEIQFSFVNAGQTPATGIWVEYKLFLGSVDGESPLESEDGESRSDLAPNDARAADFDLAPSVRDKLNVVKQAKSDEVFLEIEIFYDDVFGVTHAAKASYYGFGSDVDEDGSVRLYRDLGE